MKIWTLTENTAVRDGLKAEHGLSLYIEANGKRILFDAGQSDAFRDNALEMGIDLNMVDFAVLSHGHYDHGGGLLRFLEENEKAPVYISRFAFGEYYNAKDHYIGLSPCLENVSRLIHVGEEQKLAEGITLVSCRDREVGIPVDSAGLQKKENGMLLPDDFVHEQYLILEEQGLRVVISGCSHRGILNIIRWLPCDVLIGGFHFMKKDPEGADVREAAKQLLQENTMYYTCHCTGLEQYAAMKKIMGGKLHYLAAGSCIQLGEDA